MCASDAEFFHSLNIRTDPHAPLEHYNLFKLKPEVGTTATRALLDECKMLMMEVGYHLPSNVSYLQYFNLGEL